MKRWLEWIAVIWCLFAGTVANGANFDCEKPKTAFERLACGESITTIQGNENGLLLEEDRQKLAELDDELNAVYKAALAKHFDPGLLRREQRAWLKARERCVQDDWCGIFGLYTDRIDNLRFDLEHPPRTQEERRHARLLSMGSPPGDNFTFDRDTRFKGYGFGLCEALVRWANHTTSKGNMVDPRRTIRRMPGLNDLPWQELDIHLHMDLFVKLIEYDWGRSSPRQFLDEQVEAARNGRYRLWVVKEDVMGDHKPETLILYTVSNGSSMATSDEEQRIWGSSLIVVDDLSEVDRQANINIRSLGGMLLHYKGKPYFISADGAEGFASGSTVCSITNFKFSGRKK